MTPNTTQDLATLVNHDAPLTLKLSTTKVLSLALISDLAAIEDVLQQCDMRLDVSLKNATNERTVYAVEYLAQCRDKFSAVLAASDRDTQARLMDELKGLMTGLATYVPSQRKLANAQGQVAPLSDEKIAAWKLTKRAMRAAATLPPVHRTENANEALARISDDKARREQERANKSTVDSADTNAGKTPRKTSPKAPKAPKAASPKAPTTPQDAPTGK